GGQQLVPRAQLDPWPAGRLAGGTLDLVDRRPAGVLDHANAAFGEELVDRPGTRVGLRRQPAGGGVLEQELHGLGRVLLVRADHPRRAALDPAGAVDAGLHAPALVRNRPALRVEEHARQLDAVVAHAAEDEPARQRL